MFVVPLVPQSCCLHLVDHPVQLGLHGEVLPDRQPGEQVPQGLLADVEGIIPAVKMLAILKSDYC